jgi:plasmid stabilization system protein ParE
MPSDPRAGETVAETARRDLEGIWWYVFSFEGSDGRADATLDKIRQTIERLAERPSMGRARAWLGPGQLAFPSGSYLIVYRASAEGIEIARVSGADGDLKSNS